MGLWVYSGIESTVRPAPMASRETELGVAPSASARGWQDWGVTSESAPHQPPTLGAYLRARRRALDPADVGVSRSQARAKAGLSRAEVAGLAGISPQYLHFLERGGDLAPSRSVVGALGSALALDAAQRAHLEALARSGGVERKATSREHMTDELEELLESLDPNPAYIVDRRWDLLGANRAALTLFSDWQSRGSRIERNLLWFYCCDPAARSLFVDWEGEAADQVALFRDAYERHPDDPRYREVLAKVVAANPTAQRWFDEHTVLPRQGTTKRIRLDSGQVVALRQLILLVLDRPDIHVVSYFSGIDEGDDDQP